MGVLRHRRRRRHCHHHRRLSFAILTVLAFLLLASASATRLSSTRKLGEKAKTRTSSSSTESEVFWRVLSQKRLGGPGSSPPSCRSKCGRCSPCGPVQVPIEPGLSIPLEYYPEAWRCKCSNMLFMP